MESVIFHLKQGVGMHIARCTRCTKTIGASAEMQKCNVQSVIILFVVAFGHAGDMSVFDEFRKVMLDRTFAHTEFLAY